MIIEMSEDPNFDDAHDPKYSSPYPVPLKVANQETLKGYGTIVTNFDATEVEITPWPVSGKRKLHPGSGTKGGVASGHFLFEWEGDLCKAQNKAVGDDYMYQTGRLPAGADYDNRTHVLARNSCYHPDGGQVFFPQNGGAFVLLLALPGDDVKPEDFVAFYFDGSFGVQIHANIWHLPPYPIDNSATFRGKQGAVYACVALDFVKEWGHFLSVPLKPPK